MKNLAFIFAMMISIQSFADDILTVRGEGAEKLWKYVGVGITDTTFEGKKWWIKEQTNVSCSVSNGRGECSFEDTVWRYDSFETDNREILDDDDSTYALTTYRILVDAGLKPDSKGRVHASKIQMMNLMSNTGGYSKTFLSLITP